ncbi:MAG: SpoIID/LytB domain-containing protein [Eubacteriales bacterium]|nr:SpoIID/LytB domain-containing protein [Eubacteriales bacterium]
MAGKLLLTAAGCFLLLWLIGRTAQRLTLPRQEKEGNYISLQEAGNLAWLLADTAAAAGDGAGTDPGPDPEAVLSALKGMDASEGQGYLTWGQAFTLLELLPESRELFDGGAYRKKERVEASDWYEWFDAARKRYDPEGQIQDVTVRILAAGEQATDPEGKALSEQELVTDEGRWTFFAERFGESMLWRRNVQAVARQGGLYAVRSVGAEEVTLRNLWVMSIGEEGIRCFWNDYELLLAAREGMEAFLQEHGGTKDQVCDLTFSEGMPVRAVCREHKVSGQLLRMDSRGAEIEGQGYFPFSENLKIYRLYGKLKKLYPSELRVGYAFTDFVIEDGVIEAALVPREEKMEYIRVLIKTSDYGGAWHERLELTADCDAVIRFGAYGSRKEKRLAAGEKLELAADSPLFADSDRIRLTPEILTGHIRLENVNRSQGTADYRGSFEFVKGEQGLLAINEVLLEEYLYAVVPSEMPASYPLEALKSQAVCARTYAYARMLRAGLPELGAHVDDSAAFQVYHNIAENVQTTKAVRETAGQTLYYGEELAETYYYSTSCGYGTDASVWEGGREADYPYLMAQAIDTKNLELTLAAKEQDVLAVMAPAYGQAALLEQNEAFDGFIRGGQENFYEKNEPWYRWQYTVEHLDSDVLVKALSRRQQADPDGVLVEQADKSWAQSPVPGLGRILRLEVTGRGPGGVANRLLIEGEGGQVTVKTEHNIRYVLCDGQSPVIRQDGSSAAAPSMVPSAFFVLSPSQTDGAVVGYTLNGGGFGHGVGLSQNGARNMALAEVDAEGILSFFYKGCVLRNIYES